MYIRGRMSSSRKFQFVLDSPVGPLGVNTSNGRVYEMEYLDRRSRSFDSEDLFAVEVRRQLQRYFQNSSADFKLPLDLVGTDFQKRVWKALVRIKRGSVRTYGDIAHELNTSPRAVGNACRANPVPLIIPCHRVVSASGIGGFSGKTSGRRIDIKRWLLAHEGVSV